MGSLPKDEGSDEDEEVARLDEEMKRIDEQILELREKDHPGQIQSLAAFLAVGPQLLWALVTAAGGPDASPMATSIKTVAGLKEEDLEQLMPKMEVLIVGPDGEASGVRHPHFFER